MNKFPDRKAFKVQKAMILSSAKFATKYGLSFGFPGKTHINTKPG